MANDLPIQNGSSNGHSAESNGTNGDAIPNFSVKTGLARMLKGGVIMDVINAEQVWEP
jgi:pyridoxal 5'-phosphate synthase pdxS subunit